MCCQSLFNLFTLCSVSITIAATRECDRHMVTTTDCKPTLYILSLLPYPDPEEQPSWTEGPTLTLAAHLAVDLINNSTDILSGYNLELVSGDSGCNISSKAHVAFLKNVLYNEQNISGMVGPGCSTSTASISPLSGNSVIALINVHIAGSLLLENREIYPYAFGTLDSTNGFAEAAVSLMARNKWNRVGALYDPARVYYSTTLRYFEQVLECNDSLECSSSFFFGVQDTYIPLNVLKDSYIRVVFLFVGPDFLRKILCIAFHSGILFPTYQWVIVSRVVDEITPVSFTYGDISYTCTKEDMRKASNGALIIHYSLQAADSAKITDQGVSYNQFDAQYRNQVDEYNSKIGANETIQPSFWATSYFDAVWSLALALNNSKEEVKNRTGLDLSEYRYGHSNATDIIRNNLLQLDFNGVSGRIRFRNTTGYVPRIVDLYQITKANDMHLVAYYDSEHGTIRTISDNFTFINDTFRQEVIYTSVPLPLICVFSLITIIGVVIAFTFHILTVIYRHKKPVRASSVKLAHITYIGCYILSVGVLSFDIVEVLSGPADSYTRCNLTYVAYFTSSTGGILIFGTICAHTWRLYRIYCHYLQPGRFISERFLVAFILILFSSNLILCSFWVGFDRLLPSEVETRHVVELKDTEGSSTGFIIQDSIQFKCLQTSSFYWLATQLVFTLLVMAGALCLAILTRSIPHKDFKTKRTILLVYILSGILIVGFVTSYILLSRDSAVAIQFVVHSSVLNSVIFLTMLFLLMPPIYYALKGPKRKEIDDY